MLLVVLLLDSKAYLKKSLAENISHQSSLLLESSNFSFFSSSSTAIGLSEIFVAASNAFAAAVDDIESRLRIMVPKAAESRRVVVKLDDEVMEQRVAVYEVREIVENGMEAVWLRMEDVVLSPEAIALAVLEEREEAEEGERRGKEGEEEGEEKGKDDGEREGGDGNEEKGRYLTAHREFVERI
ncbi:uncharacterized protein MONOS_5981 [Monocercomonoides exilis]|uniref:uncharacterized protein n=1 Tax=Monocercomonoides exilis TaxID=2049356 RepID=UPI00355AA44B|nr:hypothetical protein MONOS_5981 [Monocercomonoides exilis]|eukprot:MONOS_5981.1-p1 / transcript=MONOS_5981.1 / gene=MONOS_5981 / organism=Monocercomonoides_exilis_PA203 / gene_product=unspecified product / transcript_product=unspecified product / location=Mono_scaffold00182:5391-6239(-) / protein_length=184 / sequence_SO=supercontig / SO=protein_coding / is_pseudo=false